MYVLVMPRCSSRVLPHHALALFRPSAPGKYYSCGRRLLLLLLVSLTPSCPPSAPGKYYSRGRLPLLLILSLTPPHLLPVRPALPATTTAAAASLRLLLLLLLLLVSLTTSCPPSAPGKYYSRGRLPPSPSPPPRGPAAPASASSSHSWLQVPIFRQFPPLSATIRHFSPLLAAFLTQRKTSRAESSLMSDEAEH